MSTIDISLVAPVYNEKECIENFVVEADRELKKLGRPYEIVCADDCSTDGTRDILLKLKPSYPALRIVRLKKNQGQSGAFEAGIRAAAGKYIVLIDADLQNDPADIGKLIAALEGPDQPACAAGRRAQRQDSGFRKLQSRIANGVRIWLTGDPIRDTGCSLKAFRAEYAKRMKIFRGMHRFFTTLIRMQDGKVVEIDVNHRPREAGTPKYGGGLGRTFTALRDAFAVRWMQTRRLHYEIEEL
ncbi:MAG TPA: glycosyltransferase family 2 protein [Planctomycetota bacterium]|nr:glycosyltransferase family 2 protein [Planctomycetota bacterium]